MTWLDRLIGLDDERARRERAPLWKRAAWRAVKALLRKHPGAVVSAAGTAAGYAATQGIEEGAEAVKEGVQTGVGAIKEKAHNVGAALRPAPKPAALPPPEEKAPQHDDPAAAEREVEDAAPSPTVAPGVCDLTEEQKRELVEALSPEDRSALAELARKS